MSTKSKTARLPNVHPGEVLLEDFLKPLDLSEHRLAKLLRIPERRVSDIVNGLRDITADTALRLARLFGTSHELWLNLQQSYDVEEAQNAKGNEIRRIPRYR
jgi:addiction module HigA family antidote